jgi:hypothetical protein
MNDLCETGTLADLLAEPDESKWMMRPPSGTLAGIDREFTGVMSACWLILAALLVSQIVLLIAMACVNEELANLSRLLAQITGEVALR